jgi:hypothetical protein
VTLIFLENAAQFTQPVKDLFYHAEKVIPQSTAGTFLYMADQPISVMGCTEQYQFCRPNNGPWSELTGQAGLSENEIPKGRNLSISNHINKVIYPNQLGTMLFRIGSAALLASQYLEAEEYRFSAPLPDTHWATEVQGWHWYMMAQLLREMYDFAAGPAEASALPYLTRPSEKDRKAFGVCKNQKIRDAHYYSFSILGLVITLSISCGIIILNLCVSSIIGFIQQYKEKGLHRRQQWIQDYILHLQRLAYENAGLGTWIGKDDLVPTTVQGEKLGNPTASKHGYAVATSNVTHNKMNTSTATTQEADPFLYEHRIPS